MIRHLVNLFLKKCLFFFCVISLFGLVMTPLRLYAEEWQGRVVRVVDGDTLVVERDGAQVKIRLFGIDAPERTQPFGKEATHFLRQQVQGKNLLIHTKVTDRYNRIVASVTSQTGESVDAAMVQAGLAWHYKKYSKDENLANLENHARQKGMGLWSQPQPVPPWVWRHQRHRTSH